MATRFLRCISIALLTPLVGIAWADTIYMQSAHDGSISFKSTPAVPRYAAYNNVDRIERRRRPRGLISERTCNGTPCDKSSLDRLINDVANVYNLDSALLHAVVIVESSYNPSALGPGGSAGLMQLMPGTAKRYGVEDAFDPEQNLHGGARYLRDLIARFGSDIRLAIAAYNAGEMNVIRHNNSIPPFRTTIEYVAKVLNYYHQFREAAGR